MRRSFYGLTRGRSEGEGGVCQCLVSYGHHGSGQCPARCETDSGITVSCGGQDTISVYNTELPLPGPPSSITGDDAHETSLVLGLAPSNTSLEQITSLEITVKRRKTFDRMASEFIPKHIQISGASRTTTISGLMSGTLYDVSVAATGKSSSATPGPAIMESFWTEVGQPGKIKA